MVPISALFSIQGTALFRSNREGAHQSFPASIALLRSNVFGTVPVMSAPGRILPVGARRVKVRSWPTTDLEPSPAQARSQLHTGHPERPSRPTGSWLHAPWRRARPIRDLE